jgi:hypothetical protein
MALMADERSPPPSLRLEGAQISIQHKALAVKMGWTALGLCGLGMTIAMSLPRSGVDPALRDLVRTVVLTSLVSPPVIALGALAVRLVHWRRRGVVGVEDGHLVIERGRSRTRIPLAELTEGSLDPTTDKVEILRRNGDVLRARLPSEADGHRLLAAAGLDATQRTLRVRLGDTAFLDFFSVLFGSTVACNVGQAVARHVLFGPVVGTALFLALALGIFRAVREIFGPARLVVGADGVVVEHRFRRRFFPHEHIAALDLGMERCALALTDGTEVPLKTRHLGPAQQETVRIRFEDARRAWQGGDVEGTSLSALDRGGRSVATWRLALSAVLAQADGYRGRVLSRDELRDALGSPGVSIERRLGAALALVDAGEPEDRVRIRVAAEASAEPRVRVALEKAAAGALDDEALDEALGDEQRARRVAR